MTFSPPHLYDNNSMITNLCNLNMASNKIKVPLGAQDVSEDWLLGVMQKALDKKDLAVISLKPVSGNVGLISSTFKATLKTLGSDVIRVFIKIGGDEDNPYNDFVAQTNTDIVEVKAYKEDLPRLVNFEITHTGKSEIEVMFPKVYSTNYSNEGGKRGFYLIMDDISSGFKMEKLSHGINLDQLKLTLDRIARFHAVSYCYTQLSKTEYGPEKKSSFPGIFAESNMVQMVKDFFVDCVKDFKNHPKAKHLAPYIERLSKNYLGSFSKSIETDARFLIHGDMWSNNVMFNADNTDCRIYDLQFFCSLAPYNEFCMLVYSCAHPDDMEQWLDQAFDVYYQKLADTCKEFQVQLPFTKDKFIDDCKTKGFFSLFAFIMMAYDPVCKEPNMMLRFIWLVENAVKYSPHFFEV